MGSVDMRVFCPQDAKKMLLKQVRTSVLLEEMGSVDMGVFCPQDAKKMLLKQARMVYWKNWAA